MSEGEIVCGCSQRSQALWSYCPDDFYCPQCGEAITRLVSKNRYPMNSDVGPIWIYAQKGKDQEHPLFVFPLAVKYADRARAVHLRRPVIDFQQSKGEGNLYFSTNLQSADAGNTDTDRLPSRLYRVRLMPLGTTVLPIEGVRLQIPRLVGDFSRAEQLELRVGNQPSIRIELAGPYLEQNKGGGNLVRVTHAGEFEVTLSIHAEHAPVLIGTPLFSDKVYSGVSGIEFDSVPAIQGRVSLRLANDLVAGTEIIPGQPWSTPATLYATALTTPGQKVEISLKFDVLVASIDLNQLKLTLERVEKGGVEFNLDPFSIPVMYLGECRSNALNTKNENPEDPAQPGFQPVIQRLSICNVGREHLTLTSVSAEHEYPFDWLSVEWATDVGEGIVLPVQGQLELVPYDRGEIYVKVDLRKVRKEQLPANRSLSAIIKLRRSAQDEPLKVLLTIHEVRERTPCPHPLCVDFGNTSSFASIKWHKDFPHHWPAEIGVADVHDLRMAENFPTAIFFQDAAENVFESQCEIGDLALEQAAQLANRNGSAALVSDLKRWIGSPNSHKPVRDARDHVQNYLVSDLIVLFLKRLVERAELILRKYTIQEICVSHPSKFDAPRRQMFYGLIDRVCTLVTAERPARPLKRVTADVDEANSVTVGAVFEPDFRTVFLRELLKNKRTKFVIGCFDLGGGSLDSAVMRFELRGSFVAPIFKSEYLGIGGHSGFGGDNVTLAFMECILDRIQACLESHQLPAAECLKCVPHPLQKDSCNQAFMRRNFQLLWEVAERVKVYQCQLKGRSTAQPADQDERDALSIFVQTRLVNDLILVPRIEGRIQAEPAVNAALRKFVDAAQFLIPLDEVYQHDIRQNLTAQSPTSEGYSVRKRIGDALEELKTLAVGRGEQIDLIILAGAGSRLPLVTEMVQSEFPGTSIVQDQTRTKFRVAHGLVRFLEASVGGHAFACSSHYSTFAYEMGLDDGVCFLLPAIHNCAPLRDPDYWFRVRVPGKWTISEEETDARINEVIARDGSRCIHLFRVEEDGVRTPYGRFDLSQPPSPATGNHALPLTDDELDSADLTVDIRLVGSEREMELRVNALYGVRGLWSMIPVS